MKKRIFRLILAVNKILEYQYQSIVNPDSRKIARIHNPGVTKQKLLAKTFVDTIHTQISTFHRLQARHTRIYYSTYFTDQATTITRINGTVSLDICLIFVQLKTLYMGPYKPVKQVL